MLNGDLVQPRMQPSEARHDLPATMFMEHDSTEVGGRRSDELQQRIMCGCCMRMQGEGRDRQMSEVGERAFQR